MLPQLSDTRSTDRKMTLLHYIVYVVETVFPHISTFYDDLHIEGATTGDEYDHTLTLY